MKIFFNFLRRNFELWLIFRDFIVPLKRAELKLHSKGSMQTVREGEKRSLNQFLMFGWVKFISVFFFICFPHSMLLLQSIRLKISEGCDTKQHQKFRLLNIFSSSFIILSLKWWNFFIQTFSSVKTTPFTPFLSCLLVNPT